ncbi:MAG: S-layer homology domain-containing protein [Candidatus Metalachnospira sp.]|nr:S-layer homology domain-containing protein [Candidatus Metalachnospira sp.]
MKRKAALFLTAVIAVGASIPVAAAETFKDINDVPWGGAQAYINSVYESGLMVGDVNKNGERLFRAKDNISYTETAQLVYSLSGETVSTDVVQKWITSMKSSNIPSWAYNCVAYCLENNILAVSDINVFYNADGTNRYSTRENAAYMFGKFLAAKGIEAGTVSKNFADKNTISAVCQQYVDLLSSLDIFVGDADNNFNPNKTINRAEIAVIVSKTNNLLKDKSINIDEDDASKADYIGYINNIVDGSFMLYTLDGKSVILSTAADSQYYLDGKEMSSKGIYSLTSNGILVKAEIYVNSRNIASEIYCTRADVEGRVTHLSEKTAKDKKGKEYPYNTVTIVYANNLSRSYIIDDNSNVYFDDDEIDLDDFTEILEKYPNIYGVAEVEYNDEYDIYPNAYIKELKMKFILVEEGTLSSINGEEIKVIADDGKEYEYKFDSNVRYYLDGEKVRFTAFKNGVTANLSKVELTYDNDGYITRIKAVTNK